MHDHNTALADLAKAMHTVFQKETLPFYYVYNVVHCRPSFIMLVDVGLHHAWVDVCMCRFDVLDN